MLITESNPGDYGEIRITPNIQDRVNQHKRMAAEREADENLKIALQAIQENAQLRAENARLQAANQRLLRESRAMFAGARLLVPALPAPGVA